MFGQMMPGMEVLPFVLLGLVVGFVLLVAGAAWLLTKCLPLRSVNKDTATAIRAGVAIVMTVVVVWLVFRAWPPIRREDPRSQVQVGMTKAEVRATLGGPSERHFDADGEETWIYSHDWVGLSYFGVRFGTDARVKHCWLE